MRKSRRQSIHRILPAWMLLGGLTLALSACAAPAPTPKTVVLDPAGGQVSARAGDTLELTLGANPSTGFIWELNPVDEKVLKLDGEPQQKADSQLMGAPVKQTFRFKAVGVGQVDLILSYHRPWEKGVPPEKTYQARVTIK